MPRYVSCGVSLCTNTFRKFSYLTFYKKALPKPPLARASTFDPIILLENPWQEMKYLMEITVQLINEALLRLPGNRVLFFFFCKEEGQKRLKMTQLNGTICYFWVHMYVTNTRVHAERGIMGIKGKTTKKHSSKIYVFLHISFLSFIFDFIFIFSIY